MNASLFHPNRSPPSLVAHLQGLCATLDDLGQRVREHIAEAVSQAVSSFVHHGVRAFLDRCYLQPDGVPPRETLRRPYDDDGMDPYEDEAEEFLVEEEFVEPAPPVAPVSGLLSAGLRRVGGWLQGCRRWTGLPVLGSLLMAGAAVLGSAAGLLSLADTARAGAGVLTDLFAF